MGAALSASPAMAKLEALKRKEGMVVLGFEFDVALRDSGIGIQLEP